MHCDSPNRDWNRQYSPILFKNSVSRTWLAGIYLGEMQVYTISIYSLLTLMVCEVRVTKETSLETLAVVEDQVRKSLLTRFVFSPENALPGISPSRCLHTNQVVDREGFARDLSYEHR